ncbi:hypothetical protein RB595_009090 [Gaeumannomyces hyphopodioides]
MSSAVNDPNMAAREDGTQGAPIMEQKPQHPEATAHVAAAKRGHGLKRLLAVVGGTIFVASIAGIITLGVKMNQSENKYHALSEKYNSALSEAHAMTRMIPRHDAAMAAMEGDMSSTVGVFGIEVNTVMVTVDLSTTVTVAQSTSTTETAETRPDMATFTTSEAEDVVTLSNTDNWDMPTASPWIDPAETFTEDWETTTSTTLTTSAPAETASEHSVPLGPYTFQPSDSAAADTTSTATTSGATTIHLTRSATVVVHESSSSSSSSFMARETSSAAALSGSACACTPHMHTETVWVPYTETVDNTYTQTVYVSLAAAHTTVEEGTVAVTETVPIETVSVAQPYPFSGETTTTVTVDVSETSSVMPVSHDLPPLATATWHSASSSSSSSHTLSSTTTPTSTATTMTTTRLYTFTVGPDSHVTTVTLPPLGTATHHSGNNSAAPSTTAASARNTAPYFLNGTSTARTSTVTVVRGSGTAGVLAVAGSTPAFGSPISLAASGPKTSIVASGAGAGPKIQGRGNSGSGSGTPVMGCVVMLIALALVVV